MLFNSFAFLCGFLPAVLAAFALLVGRHKRGALMLVTLSSLFFYGYWDPRFIPLICASIAFNYAAGHAIGRWKSEWMLCSGIAINLALLCFFKYSLFIWTNVLPTAAPPSVISSLVLPLGISFWTFQQIAYLVDVRRGLVAPAPVDAHTFSMLFFPHLIAGPILRYTNISRQYLRKSWPDGYLIRSAQVGILIFAIGLFKKVAVADSLAPFADAAFKQAAQGTLSPSDAWIGSLCYSFQLYFDFSGYSDMAYGLARMFGIRVPVNFFSPYKATSILDFWRRWHMSLTNFFRGYVYLPLGGNRKGFGRQLANIGAVFFLTGLWHGAGWTFILWGMGHGALVTTNHAWRKYCETELMAPLRRAMASIPMDVRRAASISVTLFLVHCLWVLFRSTSFQAAANVYKGLAFKSHHSSSVVYPELGLYKLLPVLLFGVLLAVLILPNTFEISRKVRSLASEFRNGHPVWKTVVPASIVAFCLYFSVTSVGRQPSAFLYFNF